VGEKAHLTAHVLGLARTIVPRHACHAARRPDHGGEDLQQRGLSRSVRAEEADRLATVNVETDTIEDAGEAEDLTDVHDANDGSGLIAAPAASAQRMLPV
jgi:hypothetical protein